MNAGMLLLAYQVPAEEWLIRYGSFFAVLLLLAGAAWLIYACCRLGVSRLLVSYHWLRTCMVALLLMLIPALALYAWEFGVEGLLQQSGSGHAESEAGRHMLSVYFNSIYPGIPHLKPGIEALKGPHLLLLVAGIIGYLLISGVLLSLFVNVLQNKVKNIEQGDEPCVRLKKHIVLIGRGPLVVAYLRYLQKKEAEQRAQMSRRGRFFHRACKIVLLTEDSVPEVRERIKRDMDETMMQRLIFMHGSRNSEAELKGLWLQHCREIVLLGDSARPDWDDVNVETLSILSSLLKQEKPRPCTVYFERFAAYTLFLELYERCHAGAVSESAMLPGLLLEPMCPYKNWADVALQVTQPAVCKTGGAAAAYLPPDFCPLTYRSENTIHLVIIGMSRMGMGMAIEAANLLHFPNFVRDRRCKTRITLIDAAAEREMAHWRLSARAYFEAADYLCARVNEDGSLHVTETHAGWLDTEFRFIQASAESEALQKLLARFAAEENTLLTVAVCLQNARQSLAVGLNLPPAFYEPRPVVPEPGLPPVMLPPNILIRQDVSKGLLNLLSNGAGGKYANVRAFGMMDSEAALEVEPDTAAVVAASMYDAMGMQGDFLNNVAEVYRDKQRRTWQSAPHWLRLSNRYFAAALRTKIRSMGAAEEVESVQAALAASVDVHHGLDGASALAQVEHYRWLAEKLLIGFVPLTAEERHALQAAQQASAEQGRMERNRLKAAMKHPDIVPYAELPESSRNYCVQSAGYLYCLLPSVLEQLRRKAEG